MRAIDVHEITQVAEARRAAVTLAENLGLGTSDAGRVAIVATELATNLLKHGSGGKLLVGSFDDESGQGIECLALDRGPGIENVALAMRDGYSTAGSPGTGLGAISRVAQTLDIYTRPGAGTAILARVTPRAIMGGGSNGSAPPKRPDAAYGAVAVPMTGETVNGDGWCRKAWDGGWTVMLADGLGHGPNAAEASHTAARVFTNSDPADSPEDLLAQLHVALRPTRGAAISIARVDLAANQVVFGGVGNVAGALLAGDGGVRRMVCNNGTIGHIAKHMKAFTYPIGDAAMLLLASDGLGTSWRIDAYPGLLHCHPTLVAGVFFRDFSRGRDDVTVLVCRLDSRKRTELGDEGAAS